MTPPRHYTFLDQLLLGLDQAVRALANTTHTTGKPYPARHVPEQPLSADEKRQAAAFMRINHAGEICAQALYHGQGVASRADDIQAKLREAALEEGDHLVWCQTRLEELGSHTSYLNPLWYAGSFCIGLTAGMVGDRISLGFVAETERQVIKHLQGHLSQLPKQDERSQKILAQMADDEAKHRDEAIAAGAEELPKPIKKMMSWVSKIMVKTAYHM